MRTTDTVSSSSTVTARSDETPAYSPPDAAWARVTGSLAPSSSWSALTVTVWASSQLVVVKVRVLVALSPVSARSVLAWPVTVTVTSSEGSWDSFTV